MKHLFFAGVSALVATIAFAAPALAQEKASARPVVIEYVAPASECPSAEGFRHLVEVELLRSPNERRLWRFSVHMNREASGEYGGRVTTERGVLTEKAARCDDLAASLASVIARSEAEAPPCVTPPPPPTYVPPPPDRIAPKPVVSSSRPEWRVGARADVSNHGWNGSSVAGGLGVVSLEVRGGAEKMMFELGVGASAATNSASPLRYTMVDAQACVLDITLGTSGLSFLGCLRLAAAQFSSITYEPGLAYGPGGAYPSGGYAASGSGGALWTGAGARLRWQTPMGLYVEGAVNAVYGTVSGGESNSPGWVDATLGVGFRL